MRVRILGTVTALALVAVPAHGQELVLNGGFENNTDDGCQYNLPNDFFTARMHDAAAYGGLSEVCIMDEPDGCGWGPVAISGTTKIGLASDPGPNDVDAVSLTLAMPTVVGERYDLSYYAYSHIESWSPDIAEIEFGLSTSPTSFGTAVYTAFSGDGDWHHITGEFVAPITASYLTIRTTGGGSFDSWTHFDDVSLQVHCLADLNGDDEINTTDMLMLLAAWGDAGPTDLDGDGVTLINDLLILLSEWGSCS